MKELEKKNTSNEYRIKHLIKELEKEERKNSKCEKTIETLNYRVGILIRSLEEEERKNKK